MRKVRGHSKCNDVNKMAELLTQVDNVMGRSSPYLADVDNKATGDDVIPRA